LSRLLLKKLLILKNINNMEKEFIPYEQALALKKLGFDDEVLKVYDINSSKSELYNYGEVLTGDDELYAPLYQQTFRWFREQYKLYPEINLHDREDEQTWRFSIIILGEYNLVYNQNVVKKPYYKTYEEAELDCLIKLIEITKTK